MHRFQFDPTRLSDDRVVILSKEESRHALRVLRLVPGDVVELLDGQGKKFRGIVVGEKEGLILISVGQNPIETREGTTHTVLAQAIIRPERMELLIQKACELGVSQIVPILCERMIVKLSRERWADKIVRWNKIAFEACKQCGLAKVPEVVLPVNWESFVRSVSPDSLFLLPTLAASGRPLPKALESVGARVVVAIGPEGDFSPKEVRVAIDQGAVPVTLGESVLRSETAAIYLLSAIKFVVDSNA